MSRGLVVIPFRRKREGKTDYHKRMKLLKSKSPRLVVRLASKNITAQIIEHQPAGDYVLAGVHSHGLEKHGWTIHKGNIPAAYLTGLLLGKNASNNGITHAVLDTGLRAPVKKSRLYACVKGVIDGGVSIPIGSDRFPTDNRLSGRHISIYSEQKKEKFTLYSKKKVDPAKIEKLFHDVKISIGGKND
jgi:large subunit ribosomal protein L18